VTQSILNRPRRVAIACLIFLLLWSVFWNLRSVHAEVENGSFIIYAQEDTLVDKELPNQQSWDTNTQLQLGNSTATYGPHEHIGYYKFNMSEKNGELGALDFSTFRAYVLIWFANLDMGSLGDTYQLYDLNNESWSASSITWNNRPALDYPEGMAHSLGSTTPTYKVFVLPWGNWTYGTIAVWDAYNNNVTRSFALGFLLHDSLTEWETAEGSHPPELWIEYTRQITTDEYTSTRPALTNPSRYTLTYFADEDAVVKSFDASTNFGTENDSQIQYASASGVTTSLYLKFNLSYPDLIDGVDNTENYTLSEVNFIAESIFFKQYCTFAPEGFSWESYNHLEGLFRDNETSWNQTAITWNNRPQSRGSLTLKLYIEGQGWTTYDLSLEEDYIRYSVGNNFTYSVIHSVDPSYTRQGFSNWRMTEYNAQCPYIEMVVLTEPHALSLPSVLTWTTADDYLAVSWSISPFIAGHLLSSMIYLVTVVPISFILAKVKKSEFIKWTIIIANFSFLTMFVWFGWLNVGVYVILLILTVLMLGGILKR